MVMLNQHNSASAISYPGDINLTAGQLCHGMLPRHQILQTRHLSQLEII